MGRYRWLILAAGTLSSTSLAVQIGISAITPDLRDQFHLSIAQIGIVLAATNAGLTVTLLPWGILTDRIGERLALTIGLSGAALCLAGSATARTLASLVGALAATGAFAASVNSASGRAVMHWFDRNERGLALGIRQAAVPIGGVAGALALPAMVSRWGVHAAFVALALNCVLWAVLAGVVLRERPSDEHVAEDLRSPLRDKRMWLLCWSSALVLVGQLAIMGFVVLFLHDARGLSTERAALVLAAVQVGAVTAGIGVGGLSDRTGRRIPFFVRVSTLLAVALAAAAVLVHAPLAVLVPVLVVAGTLGMSWNGLSVHGGGRSCGREPKRRGDRLPADRPRDRRADHPDRLRRRRVERVVARRVPRVRGLLAGGGAAATSPLGALALGQALGEMRAKTLNVGSPTGSS